MSSPEFVTVIIQTDMLICSALQHSDGNLASFSMRAYKCYRPDYTLCSKNALYSISYMSDSIRDFLRSNKLEHAFVLLSFCSEALHENFYSIERDASYLSKNDSQDGSLVWNSCVLDISHEKSAQAFYYVYGLTRSQILQYQIAALRSPFNCVFMTSVNRALLQLLWFMQGNKIASGVIIENTLNFSSVFSSFLELFDHKKAPEMAWQEKEALCAAMGLHLLGEQYESF